MADSSAVPLSSTPRSRVVRSLARAAERPCARPSCPAPARATLSFSYATAEALLDRLSDHADPQRYDLCARHATRTDPPRGWALVDRRPEEDRVEVEAPPITSRDLASDETVAVLAAALRAVPSPPSPAPTPDPAPVASAPVASAPLAAAPTPVASAPVTPDPEALAELAALGAVEEDRPRRPRPVPAAGHRGPATDW